MAAQRTEGRAAVRIGTRGSKLALTQAGQTKAGLVSAHADLTPEDIELVVIRTDLAADALPVSGATVDESQLDVLGRTDTIGGGESETLSLNLSAGSYVLICNVPGHWGLGMRSSLTVQ